MFISNSFKRSFYATHERMEKKESLHSENGKLND